MPRLFRKAIGWRRLRRSCGRSTRCVYGLECGVLYLALSCLQGRPLAEAAAELLSLAPGELALQLTPGCVPGPVPDGVATRTHHGWVAQAMRAVVWADGALVWRGDSVHPPAAREVGPGWEAPEDVVLETMFPGYAALSCGEEMMRAMQDGRRLAVDVAHLQIQRHHGVLARGVWERLADYDRIVEVHVSESVGCRDAHAPVSKDTWGIEWARARLRSGTPVVLECYMHRLDEDARRRQIEEVLR